MTTSMERMGQPNGLSEQLITKDRMLVVIAEEKLRKMPSELRDRLPMVVPLVDTEEATYVTRTVDVGHNYCRTKLVEVDPTRDKIWFARRRHSSEYIPLTSLKPTPTSKVAVVLERHYMPGHKVYGTNGVYQLTAVYAGVKPAMFPARINMTLRRKLNPTLLEEMKAESHQFWQHHAYADGYISIEKGSNIPNCEWNPEVGWVPLGSGSTPPGWPAPKIVL